MRFSLSFAQYNSIVLFITAVPLIVLFHYLYLSIHPSIYPTPTLCPYILSLHCTATSRSIYKPCLFSSFLAILEPNLSLSQIWLLNSTTASSSLTGIGTAHDSDLSTHNSPLTVIATTLFPEETPRIIGRSCQGIRSMGPRISCNRLLLSLKMEREAERITKSVDFGFFFFFSVIFRKSGRVRILGEDSANRTPPTP